MDRREDFGSCIELDFDTVCSCLANSARWCTSDFKAGPIQRELRRYLKAHPHFGGGLVNGMGMPAEENPARARKMPWQRNERMSVAAPLGVMNGDYTR